MIKSKNYYAPDFLEKDVVFEKMRRGFEKHQ